MLEVYNQLEEESKGIKVIDINLICNTINTEFMKLNKKQRIIHYRILIVIIYLHSTLNNDDDMYDFTKNTSIGASVFELRTLPLDLLAIIQTYLTKICKQVK